ncbi:Protein of unknown function with PCYCGC motif-containing protein [Anoxybacillus pushchinoensis]|uniref:Lipoprotein n=1 Tax=Anoxybacillus pushchinoensis TaxID=150248 RepID=A0A1I0U325_9BACL|nr:PCYCGC motif-containing (lipo)protein [Anoxybacillus pushchinoensis]SFA58511.1 Protein of unknown function with PCYCGC motif-containing protein [Anoxybacillus pushchinoensis]
MLSYRKLFPITLLSTLLIVGCSNSLQESGNNKQGHQQTVSRDIVEETKNIEVLPSFLDDKPKEMKNLYVSVAKNRELLENIPCYCGCGESSGHKNNYDCFVFKTHISHPLDKNREDFFIFLSNKTLEHKESKGVCSSWTFKFGPFMKVLI